MTKRKFYTKNKEQLVEIDYELVRDITVWYKGLDIGGAQIEHVSDSNYWIERGVIPEKKLGPSQSVYVGGKEFYWILLDYSIKEFAMRMRIDLMEEINNLRNLKCDCGKLWK